MTRQRMFLEMTCVDAARERIRHVYDTFDEVWVQFSGGKDSTAVLYLAKEVHEERGLGPVNVIFRDEEMVSPLVLDFVNQVRKYKWVNMEWYCMPQSQEVWVLGKREYVLLWSDQRRREGRLIRPMPKWAISAKDFGLDPNQPISESIDYYTMQGKKGRVAFLTGVRANESMIRYRSCVQKLHENYIVHPYRLSKNVPLKFAKVIYDWTANDCLKFLVEEHKAKYCEYYDLAELTGSNGRVGIPLHSVPIRRIGDVIRTEPDFYDRLYECFPQIHAQAKLWPEYDVEKFIDIYASLGWDGVKRCIDDNFLTPGLKKQAMAYAAEFRKKHARDKYSYPINWLIRNLIMNEIHVTSVNPVGPRTRAHALRVSEAQELAELDSLDIIDDIR